MILWEDKFGYYQEVFESLGLSEICYIIFCIWQRSPKTNITKKSTIKNNHAIKTIEIMKLSKPGKKPSKTKQITAQKSKISINQLHSFSELTIDKYDNLSKLSYS